MPRGAQKLTKALVLQIRAGHWPTDKAAAEELGTSLKSITFARKGITWKTLPNAQVAGRLSGPDHYHHRERGRRGGG